MEGSIAFDGGQRYMAVVEKILETRRLAVESDVRRNVEMEWKDDQKAFDGDGGMAGGHESTLEYEKPPLSSLPIEFSTRGKYLSLGLTRVFTNFAATMVTDLLLPAHDKGWGLEPVPALGRESLADGRPDIGMERDARDAVTGQGWEEGMPGYETAVGAKLEEYRRLAAAELEENSSRARMAETLIERWHEEGEFREQVLKVVRDAARLGTGIMCGPVREERERAVFRDGALVVEVETIPVSRAVSPWNCYADPSCGSDIQQGSFHWERDWIQRLELQKLRGNESYVGEEVRKCLEEGPRQGRSIAESGDEGGGPGGGNILDDRNRFEIWYGYLDMKLEDLRHCWPDGDFSPLLIDDDEGDVVPVRVEVVNDRVIRIEGGLVVPGGDRFPYDYFRWDERFDDGVETPWGRGVPNLVKIVQRALNAAFNRLLQNLGIASFPMLAVNEQLIEPQDGVAEIKPGKGWNLKGQPGLQGYGDAKAAIQTIEIPSYIGEITNWMAVVRQLFEDLTGLDGVTASTAAGSAPDTVGGMQLMAGRMGSPTRRVAKAFDKDLMEPHIRRYYGLMLLDGKVPGDLKGDFVVRARGSDGLLERSMGLDLLGRMAELSLNPATGLDTRKVIVEILKHGGMDSERYMMTAEQMDAMREAEEAMAQQPSDAVQVAEIREAGALEREALKRDAALSAAGLKAQSDQAVEASRAERATRDIGAKEVAAELQRLMDKAKHDDEMKVKLAELMVDIRGGAGRQVK